MTSFIIGAATTSPDLRTVRVKRRGERCAKGSLRSHSSLRLVALNVVNHCSDVVVRCRVCGRSKRSRSGGGGGNRVGGARRGYTAKRYTTVSYKYDIGRK